MKKDDYFRIYGSNYKKEIPKHVYHLIKDRLVKGDFSDYFNKSSIKKDLTMNDLLKDIDVLLQLIEYAYIGYDYFLINSYERMKSELMHSLSAVHDNAEFANHIVSTLNQFINDGHFQIYSPVGYSSLVKHTNLYFTDLVLEKKDKNYVVINDHECNGRIFEEDSVKENLFETLPKKDGTKRYLLGKISDNPIQHLCINEQRFDLHLSKLNSINSKTELCIERIQDIPILHDPSYNHFNFDEYLHKYDSSAEILKTEPVFIWNLINNGGGTDQYAKRFINRLNGKSEIGILKADMKIMKNDMHSIGSL